MKTFKYPGIFNASIFLSILLAFSCSKDEEVEPDTDQGKEEPEEKVARLPEVNTDEIQRISTGSARAGGAVTDKGSSSVHKRGVVWSAEEDPSLADFSAVASAVSASGEFNVDVEDLEDNTTYYLRAFATNSQGTGYGDELNFTTKKIPEPVKPIVYVDSSSFDDLEKFKEYWNMRYPWGEDHNGSARMYEDMVSLQDNGVLLLEAERIYPAWEGYSTADPHLRIKYHAGAVHFKEHIRVTEDLPYWEVSGDFQAPTMKGSWPAFWLTGAWSWPPEIDILEFKGNSVNWQNTVTGPAWNQTTWTTDKTDIPDAHETWHNYKLTMTRLDENDLVVRMYIDDDLKSEHVKDFTGDRFHLIINLQMEGSSGDPGPEYTNYRARNVYVAATPKE